ncbi:hypothetical protein [Pannonibacter tanglangensis]|uniref:Uncharacterized protein n=1 Tax=Pannonibacter tanglangensis TaxID=2750084 RepID=A0ABW9ZE08_9HYPH|nr:hypothetical protein [Pannonibacter sp. XCT-34]NBN62936.1 hypothetical protein [Pannonibacter sp. XCT-34]
MLLAPDRRPQKTVARAMIAVAMRDALFDKARVSARVSGVFLLVSIAMFAVAAMKAG